MWWKRLKDKLGRKAVASVVPPNSSSPLTPSMPISTRKANANAHPGRIVLETQQTRRSSQQVEEDKNRARAAAIAEKEAKDANHRAVLATIAGIEDTIEKSELQIRIHATRPDLHPNHKRSCTSKE